MSERKLFADADVLETICFCYYRNRQQIITAIESGAKTVEEIGKKIKAGTNCGRCQNRIQEIINEVNSKK